MKTLLNWLATAFILTVLTGSLFVLYFVSPFLFALAAMAGVAYIFKVTWSLYKDEPEIVALKKILSAKVSEWNFLTFEPRENDSKTLAIKNTSSSDTNKK